jgi:hypothetical protein
MAFTGAKHPFKFCLLSQCANEPNEAIFELIAKKHCDENGPHRSILVQVPSCRVDLAQHVSLIPSSLLHAQRLTKHFRP